MKNKQKKVEVQSTKPSTEIGKVISSHISLINSVLIKNGINPYGKN